LKTHNKAKLKLKSGMQTIQTIKMTNKLAK